MNIIQERILIIYKEVSKICRSNHIPFYAIGGTCIGAVRHKGFIPWDDDLDIAIPIEYFDKFLQLAGKELPDYLKLYTCDDVKHYIGLFAKVHDVRTTFIEKKQYKYPDAYKGVFVDIMPIGGLPENESQRYRFVRKLQRLSSINRAVRISPKATSFKKTLMKYPFLLFRLLPFYYITRKYYNELRKYPFYKSKYTGLTWLENLNKYIFPTEWFGEGVDLTFEDTVITCPIEYDKYLRAQFGEYMKIPSIKEQETNHDGIIDLNRPYTYYKGRLK